MPRTICNARHAPIFVTFVLLDYLFACPSVYCTVYLADWAIHQEMEGAQATSRRACCPHSSTNWMVSSPRTSHSPATARTELSSWQRATTSTRSTKPCFVRDGCSITSVWSSRTMLISAPCSRCTRGPSDAPKMCASNHSPVGCRRKQFKSQGPTWRVCADER